MHDTAMATGAAFFDAYFPDGAPRVLDVGAMNVNGSLRGVAPPRAKYVGLDIAKGPGVDVVLEGACFPFAPDSFDACVSVSCLEHDAAFWESFLQIATVCRPSGFVFLNVPSNGPYHSYPHDNWRFYPDAGLALATWAQRAGQPMQLIESGILRRQDDVWNDFVAVFQKHPEPPPRTCFLLDAFPEATNVRRLGQAAVSNHTAATQDMQLIANAQREAAEQSQSILMAQEAAARAEALVLEMRRDIARQAMSADAALQRLRDQHVTELDQTRLQIEAIEAKGAAMLRQGEARLAAISAAQAATEARLEAMLRSKSWRMTRPLRRLRRLLAPGRDEAPEV